MWLSCEWKDYELIDCGRGEKLERWGDQLLVRPDPQAREGASGRIGRYRSGGRWVIRD